MVVVSILPHAEFGPNSRQGDAPHFTLSDLRDINKPTNFVQESRNLASFSHQNICFTFKPFD